ncbi:MAG: alpha/beta hydrolase [Gammaproteobacteria bacterium]|nr:MAG: alpha/beta hydrolase [Gammaproteobacteria bacterium]
MVLVHGLWLSGWCLLGLHRYLQRCGFDARHTFSYPSVSDNLLENAEALNRYLRTFDVPVLHLVGHSLGGLVIRALFQQHPEQPRGRIVTLGTPHRGSHPASVLARTRLGRKITGRSIQQLLAGMPEYWASPERDFGIIAGDLSIGMGRLFPGLVKPNDGVVALAETRFPGATDHITLHVSHTALVMSSQAAHQVCYFLKNGCFERDRGVQRRAQ